MLEENIFKNYKVNINIFFQKIIIILNIGLLIKNILIINTNLIKYKKIKLINEDNSNLSNFINKEFYSFNFNISLINYSFSLKYKIAKLEYSIAIFTKNNNLILPSYLTLFYNLHFLCQTKNIKNNINIKYFANIYQNRYFKCIEFFNTNETMIFGITLYKKNNYR